MNVPKIVFVILKAEEKAALSLQHSQGKSTWQAGEILNKSHYKYLEIKMRAEKFFECFVTHYNTYEKLIPDSVHVNPIFALYLNLAIERRLPIKEIISKIDDPIYKKTPTREEAIAQEVNLLKDSKSLHAQNLYNTIMEFDRFNNFRVLAKSVQEPSGFKRRNSTRFKKHLKISTTLNPYTIFRIKELYKRNTSNLKKPGYVVISEEIIRVSTDEKTLKDFARISLYVFREKEKAEEYMALTLAYTRVDRNPKLGLTFWPKFRSIIQLGMNYNLIHNIAPTRRSLFVAMQDLDLYYHNKRNLANYNNKMKEL